MKSTLIKNTLMGFAAICAAAGFVPSASAAAPSGTCGLIASMPHPEMDWADYMAVGGVAITKNMDLLAEIDFTHLTIHYAITQFTWSGTAFSKGTIAGNAAFTIAGPGVNTTNTTPNAYQITFSPNAAGVNPATVVLNVLPVNSGNTYLIQGIGDRISGVCQAF